MKNIKQKGGDGILNYFGNPSKMKYLLYILLIAFIIITDLFYKYNPLNLYSFFNGYAIITSTFFIIFIFMIFMLMHFTFIGSKYGSTNSYEIIFSILYDYVLYFVISIIGVLLLSLVYISLSNTSRLNFIVNNMLYIILGVIGISFLYTSVFTKYFKYTGNFGENLYIFIKQLILSLPCLVKDLYIFLKEDIKNVDKITIFIILLLIFIPLIYYVYKYLKLQVLLLNSIQLQNKPIYLSKKKYLISRNKINEIYHDKILYKHKSLGQTIYNKLYGDSSSSSSNPSSSNPSSSDPSSPPSSPPSPPSSALLPPSSLSSNQLSQTGQPQSTTQTGGAKSVPILLAGYPPKGYKKQNQTTGNDNKETFVSTNKPVLDEKINNIIKNNDLDEDAIKTKLEENPELIDNLELVKDNKDLLLIQLKTLTLKDDILSKFKTIKLPIYTNMDIDDAAQPSLEYNLNSNTKPYNYGISFWFYLENDPINNKNENESKNKYSTYYNILNDGNRIQIKYNEYKQSLIVVSKTNKKVVGKKNEFRILYKTENILFQRWNNMILNNDAGTLDIYINGDLVASLENVVPYDITDDIIIGDNNGVDGLICNIMYFDEPLNINKIKILFDLFYNKNPPII